MGREARWERRRPAQMQRHDPPGSGPTPRIPGPRASHANPSSAQSQTLHPAAPMCGPHPMVATRLHSLATAATHYRAGEQRTDGQRPAHGRNTPGTTEHEQTQRANTALARRRMPNRHHPQPRAPLGTAGGQARPSRLEPAKGKTHQRTTASSSTSARERRSRRRPKARGHTTAP